MSALENLQLDLIDLAPFTFASTLSAQPELSPDEIYDLVLRLPRHQVAARRVTPDTGADILRAHLEHPLTTPLEDALASMETSETYILVNRPERDPAFREVYQAVVAELNVAAQRMGTSIYHATMFLFIASPNAVTPFHLDRYSAFLFQLQGTKQVHAWDPWKHDKLPAWQMESFVTERLSRTPRIDDLTGALQNSVAPGHAVHIPCMAPHWVENGNEVSLALSVHFTTTKMQRKLDAMSMNDLMRHWLRWSPQRIGQRANLVEVAKAGSFRQINKLRRLRERRNRSARLSIPAADSAAQTAVNTSSGT